MASAQLRAAPSLPAPEHGSEDGEVLSNDEGSQPHVDKPRSVDNTPRSRAKRRSRYDILEESWNKKFEDLNSKVDLLLSRTLSSTTPQRRRVDSVYSGSDSEEFENNPDDALSIHASGKFSGSDGEFIQVDENNNEQTENSKNLSEVTKKCLYDIFGDDAVVKKTVKKSGISIDKSQKEVLDTSYRTSEPNFLTAFSEDNFELFPVDEEAEKYLQVPSLDTLVDSCLVKRHGTKASFAKAKHKTLFSQPSKMIEKIAYKGQQSARLGVVMQLYIQQALGNLVETLQSDILIKMRDLSM